MRITDERLTAFINSLDTGNPAYLNELEKEARETNVPIIRTETQSLLRTLIAVNRPERILEVGTAVGFSALCMSEYAPEGCQITTIEKYEKGFLWRWRISGDAGKADVFSCLPKMRPWR